MTDVYANGTHSGESYYVCPGSEGRADGSSKLPNEGRALGLIDRAAAIRGVTRTEFVLRSSETAAIETLNERPVITLDEAAYDAFVAALDAPVEPDERLKERYARTPLWQR